MAKFDKESMQKSKLMVANLKSTGQSKFALDDATTKDDVSNIDRLWWGYFSQSKAFTRI